MSNYNPMPPRVWSRVQADCVYVDPSTNYETAYIPLTNQTVPLAQANNETKQFYKGNILQYKGNSAQLTKKQKYSQLARCAGPSRTKVFATQSQKGYTNPNTTAMKRVGAIDYVYPNQIVGAPNNISGPFAYNIPNPFGCQNGNVVQDGGTLVCGSLANPCTGEVYKEGPQNATVCFPASASNVPGKSELCWNNKIQTWFPRQRYFMNNSGDKWPEGYKGFVSAVHTDSPYLTLESSNGQDATITWTYNNTSCLVPFQYTIFLNGSIYTKVSFETKLYTFTNLPLGNNSIYVTATAYPNLESKPSNTVFIISKIPPVLTLLNYSDTETEISFTYDDPDFPSSKFNFYVNGLLHGSTGKQGRYTLTNLYGINNIYVSAVINGGEEINSNSVTSYNRYFVTSNNK